MKKRSIPQRIVVVSTSALICALALPAAADDPVDQQVLIRLAPGYDVEDFNAQYSTTTLRSIPARNIHELFLPDWVTDEEQWANDLMVNPPPGLVWAEGDDAGGDGEGQTGSFYTASMHARSRYNNQYPRSQQNLPRAHQLSTGSGMLVAILDTGIDATHELFAGRIRAGGFNFIDDNSDTSDVPDGLDNDNDGLFDESVGHGTFVAGLIMMMAPDADILPIKVLNSDGIGDTLTVASGVFYAIDQGADVINMSFGSTFESEALDVAITEAKSRGILVIASAGNHNIEEPEEFPANEGNALGIVSLDANDVKSGFSNFNGDLDFSAPGSGGIFSAIPVNQQGFGYAEWEGTSFSTAIMSGAVAAIIARNPEWPKNAWRWDAVVECLDVTSINIDPNNPGYRGQLGRGRIDLVAALNHQVDMEGSRVTRIELVTGQQQEGDLDDVEQSENLYYEMRSGFARGLLDLHRTEVLIEAHTFEPIRNTIELTIESHVGEPTGVARVFARSVQSGRFVRVGQFPVGRSDTSVRVIFDAGGFIDGNGEMQFLIRHAVLSPRMGFAFDTFIDLIDVQVR